MTDIGAVLYLAGIFIAYFSAVLILGKENKQTADYILAVWFLLIGIHLTLFVFFLFRIHYRFPYFLGLEIPFPLIHGPMLYLYILYLTAQTPQKNSWILHLAPVFIVYILLLGFFFQSPQEKIYIYEHGGTTYKTLRRNIMLAIVLSGILYVIMSFFAVRKYKKSIVEQFSNIEKINLNWANYLITGIALIWVAVIIKNDILIFTLVELFIMTAAYFGIGRVGILTTVKIPYKNEATTIPPLPIKYQKNFAGEEIIQDIYSKLGHLMLEKRLYKDSELTLSHVASALDVHPNILSQTINSVENKNFYDYINRQRIDEFKRIALLPENQKFTILALAFESGFNSKTSFNRNFKKYANCSPREFLKTQNIDLK